MNVSDCELVLVDRDHEEEVYQEKQAKILIWRHLVWGGGQSRHPMMIELMW